MVRAGSESPDVGEVEILGDQESPLGLGCLPDLPVVPSLETLVPDGIDVVSQITEMASAGGGEVLVGLDLHG